ncbi:50S ribosomal protein L25 [Patescibacteria group bacterium]|nr:50S ribosomal protein L25 [Patescibacteria group bacterium]
MTFGFIVKKRGKNDAQTLRKNGLLPGVLYGPEIESVPIEVDKITFEKLYNEAGESSLIDFTIEGDKSEPVKVLIQDVQYDPVKQTPIHFDLRQIKMGVEMSVSVELNFVGESPAVKEQGGTLVKSRDYVDIKCLPRDLVSELDVDLSVLKTFDDSIHVKDLVLPEGIIIQDDPEMSLAKVQAPLTEDQLKAMDEEGQKGIESVEAETKEGAVVGEDKEEGGDKEENKGEK